MKNKYSHIIDFLSKWKNGGMRELESGTKLICHVPHVAPEAWFHIIYSNLSTEEVLKISSALPYGLPSEFEDFLTEANGLNIFSDSLSIWGLRKSYMRIGDESIQPYDLLAMNRERPESCPESWVFFGGYSWDGSRVLFDTSDNTDSSKVYLCARDSAQILKQWTSFREWIVSEIDRLSKLYDSNGIEYDEDVPTCPIEQ